MTEILQHLVLYVTGMVAGCKKFLEYIYHSRSKSMVGVGVPNGTAKWQVGDSSEQNGCYKMANKEYKEMLCDRYLYLKQPVNIKRIDVVPIVRYSWPKSFGRKEKNKKAIQ